MLNQRVFIITHIFSLLGDLAEALPEGENAKRTPYRIKSLDKAPKNPILSGQFWFRR